jgi:hypothetical protein
MRMFTGTPCVQNSPTVHGSVAIGDVAANTTALKTVACPGALPGDFCVATPRAAVEAGMIMGQAYCIAANVVTVPFMNTTAAPLPAAALGFDVICLPSE